MTTQASCPHDALTFTVSFPKALEPWATFTAHAFQPAYAPRLLTQVRCEACGKAIELESMFTEQGMQALVDAFGAVWKTRLEDEAQKGASAVLAWLTQHAVRQQKGPKE